ncbi:hypothetical protein G6L37_00255 [Agrobacterium rubi]|nr:hypothetical protein [Agrobacterium rubi]NTF23682.1 hypothetical protein [Agrobacterium rubi]
MLNIDRLFGAASEKVDDEIQYCKQGRRRGDRAAPARYLLESEARQVVEELVARSYVFDVSDIAEYSAMLPDLLDTEVLAGDLRSVISKAIQQNIIDDLMRGVVQQLLLQRRDDGLDQLLDDIEKTIEVVDAVNPYGTRRLSFLSADLRDKRDLVATLDMEQELLRQAEEMRVIINRKDIADPPSADWAGRGRRLLLEAADHIKLLIANSSMDDFLCEDSAKVAP